MGQILVVEDDSDLAQVLQLTLVRMGKHNVHCITRPAGGQTWQETLLHAVKTGMNSQPFDVLVMDIELVKYVHEQADGRDLARALHSTPLESKPQVIMASGKVNDPTTHATLEELLQKRVIVGFMNKPFPSANVFLQEIARVIALSA
ncbi:MAG: response regulator [bacterium]|nr:response regulator [bacterium]